MGMFGTRVDSEHVGLDSPVFVSQPPEYDSRKEYKFCNQPILEQGDCGGSWAIAAA